VKERAIRAEQGCLSSLSGTTKIYGGERKASGLGKEAAKKRTIQTKNMANGASCPQ